MSRLAGPDVVSRTIAWVLRNTRRANDAPYMKAAVGLLAGVAFAFGSTYALASGSHINTRTLGAGTTSISSCQAAPMRFTFDDSVEGTLRVTLNDVDTSPSSCGNKWVKVTLLPSGLHAIATVPTSGSTVTFSFADVCAEDVRGAKVSLAG